MFEDDDVIGCVGVLFMRDEDWHHGSYYVYVKKVNVMTSMIHVSCDNIILEVHVYDLGENCS